MIISGLKNLIVSLTNGEQALLGNLWAKQDLDALEENFKWIEWILHSASVFIFGCAGTLILPFVTIYTANISDINYEKPLFAVLLTIAGAAYCIRLPYNMLILAAGHYHQTRKYYFTTAIMNIVISVAAVKQFELVGVAAGTLISVFYQMICLVYYISRHMMCRSRNLFLKQLFVDVITALVAISVSVHFRNYDLSWIGWLKLAVKKTLVWSFAFFVVNTIFYRDLMNKVSSKIVSRTKAAL